jgi:pSer/pThr/pTyr-binding forkhead associated (FHA) protein
VSPFLEVWRAEGGAEQVQLDGPDVTVGRGPDNDVVLDDPTVSRRHAVFERLAAGWSVHDLNSTNGTYVNGEPLHGARPLYSDDQIQVGETKLVYRSKAEPSTPRSASP